MTLPAFFERLKRVATVTSDGFRDVAEMPMLRDGAGRPGGGNCALPAAGLHEGEKFRDRV